eukprot:2136492-Rhodomonas_salina.1
MEPRQMRRKATDRPEAQRIDTRAATNGHGSQGPQQTANRRSKRCRQTQQTDATDRHTDATLPPPSRARGRRTVCPLSAAV